MRPTIRFREVLQFGDPQADTQMMSDLWEDLKRLNEDRITEDVFQYVHRGKFREEEGNTKLQVDQAIEDFTKPVQLSDIDNTEAEVTQRSLHNIKVSFGKYKLLEKQTKKKHVSYLLSLMRPRKEKKSTHESRYVDMFNEITET